MRGPSLAGLALGVLAAFAAGVPAAAETTVQARLGAGAVTAGTSVQLVVTITNPSGRTEDPVFEVPNGLTLLGSDRSQSFSWVNGRSTTTVEYRFEVSADNPGDYRIGPIHVRVGSVDYLSPSLPLRVMPEGATLPKLSARGRGGASPPARLVVDVQPSRPYVGQLVRLSMRLVQTRDISDSRGYSAPATPGFWSESWGEPVEYRAQLDGRSVAVTERRARLYPLAPGTATIGPASLVVVPAPSSSDPFFRMPQSGVAPVAIQSDSVRVPVRALPPGAPAAFENAVGDFDPAWSLDRGHTAQDQTVTLRLDVRGSGNLPLLHTPKLSLPDFEVFASTVDDSFPPAGEISPGRRSFQWTLLPRRSGSLVLHTPAFAWFDPSGGAYHTSPGIALPLEVISSAPAAAGGSDGAFPRELSDDAPDPGSRPARPWLFALAGLLLGAAVKFWLATVGPDALAGERAKQREFLRAVGLARGPDFWRAADEAVRWAESRGERVAVLKQDIAVARFGGTGASEDDVRRRLVERVSVCVPPVPPRLPWRVLAVALALAAAAGGWLGWPQEGNSRLSARARVADEQARAGNTAAAAAEWARLWDEGRGEDPALAARLAWAALGREKVGEAAAWIVRGRAGEPRSGALRWAAERVRESGGLVGAQGGLLPVRALEWALLAFALALAAALRWPRHLPVAVLAVLASGAAVALPLQRSSRSGDPVAVVETLTPLDGAGIELDPGEVVRLLGRDGERIRVRAGRGVEGTVPATAVRPVWGGGRP